MKIPEELLGKRVAINFADGKVFSGTIEKCCNDFYQIEVRSNPLLACSGHFSPDRIKACGPDYIEVDFNSPGSSK